MSVLSASDKKRLVLIAAFALATSVLEIVTASTIVVFGQVLNQPESGQAYLARLGWEGAVTPNHMLVIFAVLCGLVYLVKNAVAAAETFFQNFSVQTMNYHFKNRLLEKYAFADYSAYMLRNSSYNTRVVGTDAELMFSSAMVSMSIILSETIVFVCLVGLIIYINPSLAFLIFSIGGVVALVTAKYVLPLFYRWGKRAQDAGMMSWQTLLEFFHAFKEIVLLGKRDAFIDRYKVHSYEAARVRALSSSTAAMPRIVIEVLFVGLFVVTICYLVSSGQNTASMLGTLGGYLYAGFRLMPGLNRIINQLNAFKSVIPSIDRVHEEYFHVSAPENYQDVPDLTFNSHLEIDNVSYSFPAAEVMTLKNISLTIRKGEKIGIVGETGSGKSTLVDIILGLLKPVEGSVLVDGKYPVTSAQWHARIGYVAQSIYLTDSSIRSNIAFGVPQNAVDDIRLAAAIEAAQLTSLIQKLPQKDLTIVGERGIRLSGGERQRVAIARALYHAPDVLIFDEATSALDNETESRLMDTMYAVGANRTVIMIAHRLSTLDRCDRILSLEHGRFVETHTSAEFARMRGSV